MKVRSLCCVLSFFLFFSHLGFSQDQKVICGEKLEALINVKEMRCEEGSCPDFTRENEKKEILQALYNKEKIKELQDLVKARGVVSGSGVYQVGKYLYYGKKEDFENKNKFVNIKLVSLNDGDKLSFYGRSPASKVVLKKEAMSEFFRSLADGIMESVFRSDLEKVSRDETILLAAPYDDLIPPPSVKPEKPSKNGNTVLLAAPYDDLIPPPSKVPRKPASDDIKKSISDTNYDFVVTADGSLQSVGHDWTPTEAGTTNEVESLCKAGYMMPECEEKRE